MNFKMSESEFTVYRLRWYILGMYSLFASSQVKIMNIFLRRPLIFSLFLLRQKVQGYRLLYWMICMELNWFFYNPSRMLQLSEFVWTLRSLVLVVFNNFFLIDATDRSKISSNQKRLFFAASLCPFHFSWTLLLMR